MDRREKDIGKACNIVSLLLRYPDGQLEADISDVETTLETMRSETFRNGVEKFLAWYRSQPEMSRQEEYTAAFDLDPSICLNMAYHRWGDGEERGKAMAFLHQIYLEAGYEPSTGELPDYLPMMLEFIALRPGSRFRGPIRDCLQGLEGLVDRMEKKAPFYADLIDLVAALVYSPRSGDVTGEDKPRSKVKNGRA